MCNVCVVFVCLFLLCNLQMSMHVFAYGSNLREPKASIFCVRIDSTQMRSWRQHTDAWRLNVDKRFETNVQQGSQDSDPWLQWRVKHPSRTEGVSTRSAGRSHAHTAELRSVRPPLFNHLGNLHEVECAIHAAVLHELHKSRQPVARPTDEARCAALRAAGAAAAVATSNTARFDDLFARGAEVEAADSSEATATKTTTMSTTTSATTTMMMTTELTTTATSSPRQPVAMPADEARSTALKAAGAVTAVATVMLRASIVEELHQVTRAMLHAANLSIMAQGDADDLFNLLRQLHEEVIQQLHNGEHDDIHREHVALLSNVLRQQWCRSDPDKSAEAMQWLKQAMHTVDKKSVGRSEIMQDNAELVIQIDAMQMLQRAVDIVYNHRRSGQVDANSLS
jgi:hypothetical protein